MFVLGHLGIGSRLASPWSKGLQRRWILVGTLLPDLIDKPLYYGLSLYTGKWGDEIGLISCSRTLGHTALFLLLLMTTAMLSRSKVLAALALGTATHLILDNLGDRWMMAQGETSSAYLALIFPLQGFHFATPPPQIQSAQSHLLAHINMFTLSSEALGAALLAWDEWKRRHTSQIVASIRAVHRRIRRVYRRSDR